MHALLWSEYKLQGEVARFFVWLFVVVIVVVFCSLLWPLDRNYFLFHYLPIFSWEMEVGCIYLIWGTRSEDRSPVVVMGGQL